MNGAISGQQFGAKIEDLEGRRRTSVEEKRDQFGERVAGDTWRQRSGGVEESIDALTFDKAHTVASVEGKNVPNKAPKNNASWRYVELLVDSGAVDNVGDPKSLLEYRLREGEGSRCGLHYLAAKWEDQNPGGATPDVQVSLNHPVHVPHSNC